MTSVHTLVLCWGILALALVSCTSTKSAQTETGDEARREELPSPPDESPLPYLALGDSYTIGEGVAVADRFPHQLAAALGAQGLLLETPTIIARTGWTTSELAAAMDASESIADGSASWPLVTLLIGVNNQYRGLTSTEYELEFTNLLERAIGLATASERVIVVSIPDWGASAFAAGQDAASIGAQIDDFNAKAAAVCRARGIVFVDITPFSREVKGDAEMFAADGLHPSGLQYAGWVERIVPAAAAAFAQGEP